MPSAEQGEHSLAEEFSREPLRTGTIAWDTGTISSPVRLRRPSGGRLEEERLPFGPSR